MVVIPSNEVDNSLSTSALPPRELVETERKVDYGTDGVRGGMFVVGSERDARLRVTA